MSATEALKYATLKPAFFIHLDVEDPAQFISNKSLSETVVIIKTGYTKTLDPKYPFDTEVKIGWDTLRVNTASPEKMTLDCHLWAKTKEGKGVHIYYDGVDIGTQKQLDVIMNKSKAHGYDESYLTSSLEIVVDEGVEAEAWAVKKNLVGRGRFLRDKQGGLVVEYYVYALE